MGLSACPFSRYSRCRPSSRTSTAPTSRSTRRCLDTCGWARPSRPTRSFTGRSPPARRSRIWRRRGSATALNASAVVAARATGRPFDSLEFRDITFYEVEAKSVLNRVPAASRMPFEWTINVYRGCSHACVYCLAGETPILMANGRTLPLADVRVGDTIYGTVRDGAYRHYVATNVVDHWSTVKPAYRVTLEDGTELVTSGDHRFLTGRDWKHVTGTEHGRDRRPHLTLNDKLMGVGRFAAPPDDGPDYRCGYLCGMIRGDGH